MSRFLASLPDTRIYPITDRKVSGLSHPKQVRDLISRGARIIQLREKILSIKRFYEEAQEAIEMARQSGVRIIINDRVDLALALKADGVHLGQDDLPPSVARTLLGSEAIIGFSTHTFRQAIQADHASIDYLAIGPIFETRTKLQADPTIGLATLEQIRKEISGIPLVAIGGITTQNLPAVRSAGADAVAIISDLWPSKGTF